MKPNLLAYKDLRDSLTIQPPLYIHVGDVYYDPRINRFIQLRETREDCLIFGSPCEFYNDAKTTVFNHQGPVSDLNILEKVEDVSKFERARLSEQSFYRVKEEFEPVS